MSEQSEFESPTCTSDYDEKYLKHLSANDLIDRLPHYAQIVGYSWPDGTSDEVLKAWAFGAQKASEHIKEIIQRWRVVNAGI